MSDDQDGDIENASVTSSQSISQEIQPSSHSSPTKKKLSKDDMTMIDSANDILDSLEHNHRNDLSLHLYSSFLLKKLLYKANSKKHAYETNQFIKTQIKDNWVSWPNPNAIIDPQTNNIYEDIQFGEKAKSLTNGEISINGLNHARDALALELNAHWIYLLNKSSGVSGQNLDVDILNIPDFVINSVIGKLDHIFSGINHKIAKQNKVKIAKDNETNFINIDQLKEDSVKINRQIRFDFHDIIESGCQMNEDMKEIYMKSLELYNDIPETFRKKRFTLPKKILKRYKSKKTDKKIEDISKEVYEKLTSDYVRIGTLLRDGRISSMQRRQLKRIQKRERDVALSKKTFFEVKGFRLEEEEVDFNSNSQDLPSDINNENKKAFPSWWSAFRDYGFDSAANLEEIESTIVLKENGYDIEDAIVSLPHKK
ncbi:hypothetical protein KAFR_0B03660 [Kazachstania africana CBS 2517]|uniref:Rrn9 domain-containing protein n=1 Tax=Kazachstania africana (strain ATCC 22294 / BCRC 22015 / CBS 2517 / CECT 1963 / NBRC 1671 / NRRL Y-8276) TaxID=1071382 RepID=H2AQL3_KAZAF|nr:hypothetical protein KAFR_0B03660 [Kazachstania africana CBS 2517]CCF56663.1 hypothetical protein KAFR_0B03660 [Kazachstania africana CBS 2517]